MKKMSKKTSIIIFVTILVAAVGGIAGIFWHAYQVTAQTERPFVHERRQSAERHYRDTLGRDMENDYPRTPREFMELYATTVLFLYGDFIELDTMFAQVMEFQRSLFTEELRGLVTLEEQLENFHHDRDILREAGAIFQRAHIGEFTIDYFYERHALVEVDHRFMFQDSLYRLYHLTLDENDRWRIASWAVTDEFFNLLEFANE